MSPQKAQQLMQKALELEQAAEDSTKSESEIGRLALEAARLHFELAKNLNEPPDPTRGNLPDPNSHVNRALSMITRARMMCAHGNFTWGPSEKQLQRDIEALYYKDRKSQPMVGSQSGLTEDYERIQRIKEKGLDESLLGGKTVNNVIVRIAKEFDPSKCPGGRQRSGGEGRGMGHGKRHGPIGVPIGKKEVEKAKDENTDEKSKKEPSKKGKGKKNNPWRICYHSLDLDHKPEPESEIGKKFERCVMDVKRKKRKKSASAWSITKISALPPAPVAAPVAQPSQPSQPAAQPAAQPEQPKGQVLGGFSLVMPDGARVQFPTLDSADTYAQDYLRRNPSVSTLKLVGADGTEMQPIGRNQ